MVQKNHSLVLSVNGLGVDRVKIKDYYIVHKYLQSIKIDNQLIYTLYHKPNINEMKIKSKTKKKFFDKAKLEQAMGLPMR